MDVENLPVVSTTNRSGDDALLQKALKRKESEHMYHKQWIELLFRLISDTVRANQPEFVKEEQHINSLATAMSAWRTSMKVKKHPQAEVNSQQKPVQN